MKLMRAIAMESPQNLVPVAVLTQSELVSLNNEVFRRCNRTALFLFSPEPTDGHQLVVQYHAIPAFLAPEMAIN